ncbi:MAG: AI-2E family transporter YdiK [Rouxiella badensis]|jgi:predicted PurR-regulated permease PerM|uniref:AI-2E family transporter YdiK n=1 Tax=Rouxiella badensis TaxID=1646377 RepID=UPI0013EF00B4|nr:AI-2E family transporter YdiK [Rouxiella badensis]QII37450.1 AI-2E family transporter YdiK [Rouxiella badensis]QOI54433.1 AI-2E family transporter YdiK [Rouxiella badensis subsp. acadiensis]
MNLPNKNYDLPQIMFGVLFIALMTIASIWVVKPFILGFSWAGMIVIATWPVMIRIQALLWGRRILAVIVMTVLLILLFVLPIALLISSAVENSAPLAKLASNPSQLHLPDFTWLESIPLIGKKTYLGWHTLINSGGSALLAKVQPYIGQTAGWFVSQAANIGRFILHCSLMLLFSALLYYRGEHVGMGIRHFAIRLAGGRGDAAVILAGQAIRAVALGVVVTAIVQSVLGGIGLAIVGIPYATLLTVVMFVCCVAQIGPLLVLIPAIIWLYWTGDNTWGTVLLVWSCVVGSLDSVLRPYLIHMGADLPMLLILSGVIGGLVAFGLIGLFIGPVVLAVSYRLISLWVNEAPEPQQDLEEVNKLLGE